MSKTMWEIPIDIFFSHSLVSKRNTVNTGMHHGGDKEDPNKQPEEKEDHEGLESVGRPWKREIKKIIP